MKAFIMHFSFEFLAGLRNRTLLLMNYLLPLGFYLLVGGMMVQLNPAFGDQLIPGMVVFAVLSGVILGLPTPLVEAREAGILRSYKVNGVPASSLLAIPACSTVLHMAVVTAVITLSAPMLYASPLPVNWSAYLLVFFLTVFAYSGLGSLIGVLARNSRSAVLWQQLIYLPSILLGGLMVPAQMLPDNFVRLGHLLPATYAMIGLDGLAYRRNTLYDPLWAMLSLFIGGLVSFVLAFYLFTWDDRNTSRGRKQALAVLALVPYMLGALFLV
ncbi:MAG: ABC transporter permease [Limnochordia bacterium]|jgi:ABC-2 type transport system permease protein